MMAHKSKGIQDKEDVSVLRTPIKLHGKPVEQVLNSIHYGTPELRSLLLDECDIIFECKVCRALFRDLANFVSHKRKYCSKSAAEDNYLAIARMPDEKVYVVHPQEPPSSHAEVSRKPKSKPSLEETIARIQSGETGHSHAFKVYTDAANKLQTQKEEMKVACIRTSAIPTNSNAVFVDVNMTSVNIHERSAAASSHSSSKSSTASGLTIFTRKAKERMSSNKDNIQAKKSRILRKDCKNSEELQKLLLKELKDIQHKVKQKTQGKVSLKHSPVKGDLPKAKSISSERDRSPSLEIVKTTDSGNAGSSMVVKSRSSDSLVINDKQSLPSTTKDRAGQSPCPDLIFNGRQNSRSANREFKGSRPSDLGLIMIDRKNVETHVASSSRFKDKGNQLMKPVFTATDKQPMKYSKSPVTKDRGNQSSDLGLISLNMVDKQNSKSTITKMETAVKIEKSVPKMHTLTSAKKREISAETISPDRQPYDMRTPVTVTPTKAKYTLRRKDLICSKCHVIFSSSRSLSFHKRIKHSPERTFYPCLYCPSVFYYFNGVTRHLRLQHSKSKSEVNSLRKQLRAKAYTKVLPEMKDHLGVSEQPSGLRKSLRNKQEAFSSQTSPDSSYVWHSVKRIGKKLSAKQDAFSTPSAEEEPKDSDKCTSNVKRDTKSSNSTVSDFKSLIVKNEVLSPSVKPLSDDSLQKLTLISSTKSEMVKKSLKSSSLSPIKFPLRQNHRHKCKKCGRQFSRHLTFKNHVTLCKGNVTALSRRRKREKPRRNSFALNSSVNSTVSTRRQIKQRSNRSALVSGTEIKASTILNLKPPTPLKHTTRSSRKHLNEFENTIKREDLVSESSTSCNKRKIDSIENDSIDHSKLLNRPSSSLVGCEHIDFASNKSSRKVESVENQVTLTQVEKKSIEKFTHEDDMSLISNMTKSDVSVNISDKAAVCQKESNQLPNRTASSSQLPDNDGEKGNGKGGYSMRNQRGIKSNTSHTAELLVSKSKTAITDSNKEKRASSVERNLRGKISHLIPRASSENIVASNKDSVIPPSLSSSSSSISQVEERPKRKRKVPSRNIDAMEMLSKIHNPDIDPPSIKKSSLCLEIDSSKSKPSRGSLPLHKKQDRSIVKAQKRHKTDGRLREKTAQTEDKELKKGRATKSRSRIFVFGRKRPKGKKRLHTYDNARVDKLTDTQNSKCLVCGEIYSQIFNLRRHVIRIHLQWRRFQCNLCRFASFDRSECTTHIIRNHRREVNVGDTQAINSFITDLARQGSRAMNMKKNQTLRDKNKQQSKETNIYTRPNVRKMPRLAERTSFQEKGQVPVPSSAEKQMPDDNRLNLIDNNVRSLRHSTKPEALSRDVLDTPTRKNFLPFNISTRNSPRIFDTRPYDSSEVQGQGQMAVLHTRKGVYTKTVPPVRVKDNSESEVKDVTSKDESTFEIDNVELDIKEKPSSDSMNLSSNRNIFDELGHADIDTSTSDVKRLNEVNMDTTLSISEEIQRLGKQSPRSQSCEENKLKIDSIAHNLKPLPKNYCQTNMNKSPSSSGNVSKSALDTCSKEVDSNTVFKISDSAQPVSRTTSPSKSLSSSVLSVSLSDCQKTIKINPSYVIIESNRLPATCHIGSSSATKALNFSGESPNTSTVFQPVSASISNPSPSHDVEECQSKSTFIDDITDNNSECEKSQAPVAVLGSPSAEQTPPTSEDE